MASEASSASANDCAPATTDIPQQDGAPPNGHGGGNGHGHGDAKGHGFIALALGSIGVVFGDIGTSPLYALREALAHSRSTTATEHAVLGVVSLVLWTMTLFVTIKYVIFFMRADNKGEGGTLALMALAQKALGKTGRKRSMAIFFLGVVGAALFYGDGIITPAISVLSAVEGLKDAPGVGHVFAPYILPISAGILILLFAVQAKGTHRMASLFGPFTAVWFLILGALGAWHLADDLSILRAFNPWYGLRFLFENGFLGFVILGSVFLVVTGAEALYADMGHFGKRPIQASWLCLVFPCLALNYLGQGSLVLDHPAARHNPFWEMVPGFAYWPVLIMATVATVIASQAVITGAFSMTQQAVQLGLLPRIEIKRTSETQAGQIFVPAVNQFLLIGVLVLLFAFRSSHKLASAYGIAVTGAMFVDTLLAYVVIRRVWKWPLWQTGLLLVPLAALDMVFIASNMLKIPDGAWLPLVFGAVLVLIMWTWTRGANILTAKTRRDSVPLVDLMEILRARAPHRAPGTAIFLTSDPEMTPVALMHNLKHNKVLHERNVILTVRTTETPRVREEDRVLIEKVNDDFKKVIVNYGFMESPNIPKALAVCRKQGLKFDIMATSFFLGRRSIVPSANSGMPLWQDRLFIYLMKNAANPTDFFKIPPGRVVELGAQVTV
ncbi:MULTISPECIES: potassium transporter Kup [unclassified Caulobacter]|jgi:KUP system potassium uptake protein|uniref:potassium transporter Kup n=1 Tax=unclassified Caulobacter TaxID=2648921 RepID=UPI0006F9C073|nr:MULTISPECIES: potassium transporter Kup [unclassified Caulobacter]KQV62325.1 potassium transport protein Kup [Caulobacter sp. Root342]KQV65667.1 potassium transport protein Kup [Caulobacter sp. Root343]